MAAIQTNQTINKSFGYTIKCSVQNQNPFYEMVILNEPNIEKYYGKFLYFGKPNSFVLVNKDTTSTDPEFVLQKFKKNTNDDDDSTTCVLSKEILSDNFAIEHFFIDKFFKKELFYRVFEVPEYTHDLPVTIRFKLNYLQYMFIDCLEYNSYFEVSDFGTVIKVRSSYLSISKKNDFFGFLNDFELEKSSWFEKSIIESTNYFLQQCILKILLWVNKNSLETNDKVTLKDFDIFFKNCYNKKGINACNGEKILDEYFDKCNERSSIFYFPYFDEAKTSEIEIVPSTIDEAIRLLLSKVDLNLFAEFIGKFFIFCEKKSLRVRATFDKFSRVTFNGHDIFGNELNEMEYILYALRRML